MNRSPPHGVRRCHKPQNNAARERSRVKTLRSAFLELQRSLPAVPPNTKLSKLDVLVLATTYIYHLSRTLESQSYHDHQARTLESQSYHDHQSTVTSCLSGPPVSMKVSMYDSRPYRYHTERNLYHAVSARTADVALNNLTPSYARHTDYVPIINPSRHMVAPTSGQSQGDHAATEVRSRPMEGFRNGVKTEHQSGQICQRAIGVLRPVKKWPMRSRLYDSILGCTTKGTLSSQYN